MDFTVKSLTPPPLVRNASLAIITFSFSFLISTNIYGQIEAADKCPKLSLYSSFCRNNDIATNRDLLKSVGVSEEHQSTFTQKSYIGSLLILLNIQKNEPKKYQPEKLNFLMSSYLDNILMDIDQVQSFIGPLGLSSNSRQTLERTKRAIRSMRNNYVGRGKMPKQIDLDTIRDYLLSTNLSVSGHPYSLGYYLKKDCPITGDITPFIEYFENGRCPKTKRERRGRDQRMNRSGTR